MTFKVNNLHIIIHFVFILCVELVCEQDWYVSTCHSLLKVYPFPCICSLKFDESIQSESIVIFFMLKEWSVREGIWIQRLIELNSFYILLIERSVLRQQIILNLIKVFYSFDSFHQFNQIMFFYVFYLLVMDEDKEWFHWACERTSVDNIHSVDTKQIVYRSYLMHLAVVFEQFVESPEMGLIF